MSYYCEHSLEIKKFQAEITRLTAERDHAVLTAMERNTEIHTLTAERDAALEVQAGHARTIENLRGRLASSSAEVERLRPVVEAARVARDAYFIDEATDMAAILSRAMVFLSKKLRALDGEP